MMRRAPIVLAGTVVGVGAVLGYPTHRAHLTIPAQAAGTTPSSTPSGSAATSVPPPQAPGPAPTPAAPSSAARQATGADQTYPYGDLSVQVKVRGTHITDVAISQINDGGGQSASIDQQAIPLLRQEVLAAQSTNINGVSGATYTSQAYVDSVQSALDQLGVK